MNFRMKLLKLGHALPDFRDRLAPYHISYILTLETFLLYKQRMLETSIHVLFHISSRILRYQDFRNTMYTIYNYVTQRTSAVDESTMESSKFKTG
jgi:hypothetical protein